MNWVEVFPQTTRPDACNVFMLYAVWGGMGRTATVAAVMFDLVLWHLPAKAWEQSARVRVTRTAA